jgi:uncharacterized protein (DUF885 family)
VDYRDAADQIIAGRGQVAESARLRRLFDLDWEHSLEEYPEFATYIGDSRYNGRWTDWSLEAVERRRAELDVPAAVLATIDPGQLDPADRLHFELFKRNVDEALEGRRFRGETMPITQMQGIQQDLARLLAMTPAATVRDFEDRIARLKGIPLLVGQNLTLMRKGMEAGLTPPRVTLRDVPDQIRNQLAADPFESPLLVSFARLPEGIPSPAADSLREEAVRVYRQDVVPAFEKVRGFGGGEYLPQTRETIALSDLPDGEAWYAFAVRQSTTTRLAPREIHEIGLREVGRIRGEMDGTIAGAGFSQGFAAFVAFLRSDPQFFFEKPEDLLVAYRDICKRADPQLARLFGRLPRLPYGVLPVPGYAEKSQTAAFYEPGSPQAGRPGYFFANTYDLKARPKWEMEALALHEAVPGHHLQLSLAQELPDIPEFRRHAFYTAFIEGWGLYAESLGGEMGFYREPYSRFGQLTYEIWRAIRLVVDTGIHALGWGRDQAIAYFEENAGKAHHDIVVEVDRYIVWPSQALAYKIGELKIKELRARAAAERGETFDVRDFHDVVLGQGALPLDVLEEEVKAWLGRA